MRTRVLLVVGAIFAFAAPARADEKQVCSEAYTQAQMLRDAHKLLKSREQLRVCTRAECTWRATECAKWLNEVETAIPSIVFEAKDAGGADLSAVKVSIDGTPLADRLDGSALSVDPGEHVFRFETEGLPAVEKKLVVREGEKQRRERIVLGAIAAPAPANESVVVVPAPRDGASASSTSTLVYVGYGAGAVGAVAAVIFGAFALSANSGACPSVGCKTDADTKSANDVVARWSTFAWISGAVALVGVGVGTIALITSPSDRSKTDTGAVRIAPSVGAGWLGVTGRF